MPENLSDKELVKAVRGPMTKSQFARLLGVTRPLIPAYERGAAKPSRDVWLKMAPLARYPFNIYCYQRAGFTREVLSGLLAAMREANEFDDATREALKAKQSLEVASPPEPVEGDKPVGGEHKSDEDLVKTVEEFWARNPAVKTDAATGRAIGRLEAEVEPPAPAKKAKRERRRRK